MAQPPEDPGASLLAQLSPLAEVSNAFQAELAGSALLAGAYIRAESPEQRGDVVTRFGQELVRVFSQAPAQPTLVALAGLSALLPEPHKLHAARAMQAMARNVPRAPQWLWHLGRVHCTGAWRLQDLYGDLVQYLGLFEYNGGADAGPEHVVAVRVDRNFGVILQAELYAPGRPLVDSARRAGGADGVSFEEIEPGAFRADVSEAMERTDDLPYPPGGEDYARQWSLIRARLATLPGNAPPSRPMPLSNFGRHDLACEFADSPEGVIDTPQGQLPRDVVIGAAREAIDYAVEVNSGEPLRWSPTTARIFLLHWMPRLSGTDPEVASWLPEVLDRFVTYAGRVTGLPEAAVEATRRTIAECSARYTEAMHNKVVQDAIEAGAQADVPENPSDIIAAMRADGVDPENEEAARAWLTGYYQRRADEDPRNPGPQGRGN